MTIPLQLAPCAFLPHSLRGGAREDAASPKEGSYATQSEVKRP